MSWYDPWGEIRRLKADVAEDAVMERSLRQAIAHCHSDMVRSQRRETALQDENFMLKMEVERLRSRLENAVFRDPETGRLLPKGQVPA